MLYGLICILLSCGGYALISQLAGLPPGSTARGVRIAAKKESTLSGRLMTGILMPLVKIAAPLIRISDFKKKRVEQQLKRAGIPLTPCEYYARSLVAAVVCFAVAFLLLSTAGNLRLMSFLLAVTVFFHFHGEVKDALKQKYREIEAELPKFVRAIVQGLKTEKDVIKLLETYQMIAGRGLKYDISVLIMDLKSGNFEEGMLTFDSRLGNSYISRLTKALIAVNRGDNQDSTLSYLLSDMGLLAKEIMQRELAKRPGRIKMLVIPVVLTAVCALFYVIGMNLFTSLGGIM